MYSFKVCIISVFKSVLSDMSIAASVPLGFRRAWNIKDNCFLHFGSMCVPKAEVSHFLAQQVVLFCPFFPLSRTMSFDWRI